MSDFYGYADREFVLLRAWLHGQITRAEYKHGRWWAYRIYGYTSPHPYGNWRGAA